MAAIRIADQLMRRRSLQMIAIAAFAAISNSAVAGVVPPNPCPLPISECSQSAALATANAGLSYYQAEMSGVQPYMVHYDAEPGSEYARYCVRWTNPSGCYYETWYRARTFVELPYNPCGYYPSRVNCTKASALAIAKQAELYYLQRYPNVGAYIADSSPNESKYCVRWTNPSGCYFEVWYMDGVEEKSNECD